MAGLKSPFNALTHRSIFCTYHMTRIYTNTQQHNVPAALVFGLSTLDFERGVPNKFLRTSFLTLPLIIFCYKAFSQQTHSHNLQKSRQFNFSLYFIIDY